MFVATTQCEMATQTDDIDIVIGTKPAKQTCEMSTQTDVIDTAVQCSEPVYNTVVCHAVIYEQVDYESESEETIIIVDKCDSMIEYEQTEYECCEKIDVLEYCDAEFGDISTELSIDCETIMLDKCEPVSEY